MREKTRILIAEDDEASRIYLQRVLEKSGYDVVAAEDGLTALDMFEKEDIRLVITDWIMPRMAGLELCKAIREKATEGYVFIIMVTAKDRKNDIVEAIDAGSDDYVTKPYDKGELLARVRAGLRIIHLEQELSEKNQELFRANTTMKNDLIAAGRVQKSFLPKGPPKVPDLDFSWFFEPCDMVGGDTFNCFALDSEHIAMYVLDVSGHGVSAALLSVMLSRVLTPDPEKGGILICSAGPGGESELRSPKEVVQLLNRRFPMDEDVGQYFTILYGIIHLPTLQLKMIQAGHPYFLVLHGDGQVKFFQRPGFPVGMFGDAVFEEEILPLFSGDRVFLFSDGIVEAVNHGVETYGLDRLARAAASYREQDISGITKGILEDVMSFTAGAGIRDDMTLFGVSVK